jgi:hypothetical protein
MQGRLFTRLIRLLTIGALLLGLQTAAIMSSAAIDMASGAMPMPGKESPCTDCGKGMMPTAQCMTVCSFVLFAPGEPVPAAGPIIPALRPALAAMPAGWSMPPETAPPRI